MPIHRSTSTRTQIGYADAHSDQLDLQSASPDAHESVKTKTDAPTN
jgi:hypothetical protein